MTNLTAEDLRQIERLIDSRAKRTEDQMITLLRQHFESLIRELGHKLDRLSAETRSEVKETLTEQTHGQATPSQSGPTRQSIPTVQL